MGGRSGQRRRGGASHIDTWDMKPDAPREYRGEFRPIATTAPGLRLCEHLPLLARQAHHLAVINSLGHFGRGTGDHHAGYYYNLTGHAPDPTFRQLLNDRKPLATDWPFMGSVVVSKRPAHPYLPSLLTLPQKPGFPRYTRPGQFAARLGLEYDPAYLIGSRERPLEFAVPALTLQGDVSAGRLQSRRELLRALDGAARAADRAAQTFGRQQEKAFALLSAARMKGAFDLSREPPALRDRYGPTVNGMSLLLARRLAEAGVPFITVFWMEDPKLDARCKSGGGWDTHGNNFGCLREHLLPEFDRAFSALLADLHDCHYPLLRRWSRQRQETPMSAVACVPCAFPTCAIASWRPRCTRPWGRSGSVSSCQGRSVSDRAVVCCACSRSWNGSWLIRTAGCWPLMMSQKHLTTW